MGKKRIVVNIYGNQYAIYTDEDENYVLELAKYVDSKMREIAHEFNVAGTLQVSILTSFNIVDILFKNKTFKDKKERIEHLNKIIKKIDDHLEKDTQT